MMHSNSSTLMIVFLLALSGCGGSGSGNSELLTDIDVNELSSPGAYWAEGEFDSETLYEGYCASPGEGDQLGTAMDEKMWLRSWINEYYLWYDEVDDVNPAYYSVQEYFDVLKTFELTESGNEKDRFHFYYEAEEWQLLQSGIVQGYGVEWLARREGNEIVAEVAYVELGSPADLNGVKRGDRVLSADDIDFSTALQSEALRDAVIEALAPTEHHAEHVFVLAGMDGVTRTVSLTSDEVATSAVFDSKTIDTETGTVGYMLFNSHNLVAQDALIQTIESFVDVGISDLVLDLRYNGGGVLAVASQLAYMIAGNERTQWKTFENLVFSDKHPVLNPFTARLLEPYPFLSTTFSELGESQAGIPLPTLNLDRVFVLTTARTCSASESIMNSLRGVDVDVIQIGSTTCGKPYGFYGSENCGYTYFSINFRGENEKGFGDYGDGFSPQNTRANKGFSLEGCFASDDLSESLGSENEEMLATALSYRETGVCNVNNSPVSQKTSEALPEYDLNLKHPIFTSKFIRH